MHVCMYLPMDLSALICTVSFPVLVSERRRPRLARGEFWGPFLLGLQAAEQFPSSIYLVENFHNCEAIPRLL